MIELNSWRSVRRLAGLAMLLAAAVGTPAAAQNTAPADTSTRPPPQDTTIDAAVGLTPGDVLRVVIWREPDLSGEFIVDSDGVVTLPMIGVQRVTGIPLGRLRTRIMEQYRVNLRNPSITVTTLRRIQVLGQVNRPGLYNLDPTVTLSGAIATASGASPLGDLRRIRLVRGGKTYAARVGGNETLNTLDVRSGDQIYVGERSWIDRNSAFLVGALISTATTIVVTLIATAGSG
ncbi:MAG TPA: polysaccharide biosynthesis/export family protein [Longimicrobium sp.]|jgi:polysaccharide export outer membrane protein